jgi:Fe/S biogenesis protein NfuA
VIKISNTAREKIKGFLKDRSPNDWGIRVRTQGSQFGFALENLSESPPTDSVVDCEGVKIVVDSQTSKMIDGGTVDFVDKEGAAGFTVDLPQVGSGFGGADSSNPQVQKVQDILTREINPSLAAHGGMARVVDVKENVVYLQFGGGCQGCSMIDTTVKQGIETRLKELMPEIVRVTDETDHTAGSNPYYKASR